MKNKQVIKAQLFQKYFIRLCKEVTHNSNIQSDKNYKDIAVKIIVSGVKWMIYLSDKDYKESYPYIDASFKCIINMFLLFTPKEIATIFPPNKVYQGKKYNMKDYFYAQTMIDIYSEYGFKNNPELLYNFFTDLTNVDLWMFLVVHEKLYYYSKEHQQEIKRRKQIHKIRKKFRECIILHKDSYETLNSAKDE